MNRKTSPGFSLVEILIALVISAILMGGVISIMISTKRTYGLQDELAKLQDNARFAVEDLAYSIRMTKFKGCASSNDAPRNPFLKNDPNVKMISGENNKAITDTSGHSFPDATSFPASDTLVLRFLNMGVKFNLDWYNSNDSHGGQYSPATLNLDDKIYLSHDSYLPKTGQTVIVIDCHTMTQAKVTEANTVKTTSNEAPAPGSPYIALEPLSLSDTKDFKRPIDIFPLELSSILYEVKATPDPNNPKLLKFALYKEDANNPKFEDPFIEGVENLQVRYGRQTATGITYSDELTSSGDDVFSIRVTLLMRTVNPRYDLDERVGKPFFLDSTLSAASIPGLTNGWYDTAKNTVEQYYRHRLFTTTVQIRNQ